MMEYVYFRVCLMCCEALLNSLPHRDLDCFVVLINVTQIGRAWSNMVEDQC